LFFSAKGKVDYSARTIPAAKNSDDMKTKKPKMGRDDTLLARMRSRLIGELGISPADSSNTNLIKKKLLETHRHNPEYGRLMMRFFGLRETWITRIDEIPSAFDIDGLLAELETEPWPHPRFLELQAGPEASPTCTGIFIFQEPLVGGGRVYVITIMEEEFAPLVSRAEVRAAASNPEPFFCPLGTDGYVPRSQTSIRDYWDDLEPQWKIAFLALNYLNDKRRKLALHPAESAKKEEKQFFPPPADRRFDELIRKVVQRKAFCTKVDVPLNTVRPADYEFAMLLPAPLVRPFMVEIQDADRPELLVYWKDDSFITGDDYASYLAYRALGLESVPVVVMGTYPKEVYGDGKDGGPELLPKVTYRYSQLPSDPVAQERALENRIRNDFGPSNIDRLYSFILQLHRHLKDPLTKERALHDLLVKGAQEFAEGAFHVLSEVWLGKKYRVDLVVQPSGGTQRVLLVELERANLPLFTKSGAPMAHVTHALQQVEDWLRFWQEHPSEVPRSLDPTISPAGVVILGRSKHLTEDQRRRLLSLNSNRRVQLLTYDDLLERIETYAAWSA
jgi:hypothetical protein